MKQLILLTIGLVFYWAGYTQSAKLHTLSPFFTFTTNKAPNAALHRQQPDGQIPNDNQQPESFTVKLTVNLQPFTAEQTLLEIPGLLYLKLRQADPANRHRQNYPAAKMPDGSLPVLEAGIRLGSPGINLFSRELEIGHPLASLKNPWGQHEVTLHFSKSQFTMYVDNELMDNDFVVGYPHWWNNRNWQINPALVSEASIYKPGMNVTRDHSKKAAELPELQYWLPRGHNSWVGDVATIFHEGRYHVFYLYDRRHHDSKLGTGGHYFEHFSTTDFITWTEHEAATPIDEQWETFGTGTPFIHNGKLHLSYGYHTSRIYPDSLTTYPGMTAYYNDHKKTGYFLKDPTKLYPSGSSYSVSADNISKFKKSGVLLHFSENPSIFTTADGKLKMFANFRAKGTWESASLDSGWYCTDPEFPNGGDCTFDFKWGKYEYVVGGFVNLWKRSLGSNEAWTNLVAQGRDFYNGVNVPSVSPIGNGRYIMAGWMPITGWGGPFMIHELVQFPDGRIGTKWMKELVPAKLGEISLAKKTDQEIAFPAAEQNFILSFEVYPKKKKTGTLGLSFWGAEGRETIGCEMQINLHTLTAQYADAVKNSYAGAQKSLKQGGEPHVVGNYAIENLTGIDKPFQVRILVKTNSKLGGTILDTEIAGQNTLVTYRKDLAIETIRFNPEEISIRNIKRSPIAP